MTPRQKLLLNPSQLSRVPRTISGLIGWYAPESAVAIDGTSGTTTISRWDDLSGFNYHLTQATKATQATIQYNVINGYRVTRFDGAASGSNPDNYIIPSAIANAIATTSKSVFAVVIPRTVDATSRRIITQRNSGGGTGWNLEYTTNYSHSQTGNTVTNSSVPATVGTPALLETINNGVNDDFYINGSLIGSKTTSTTFTVGNGNIGTFDGNQFAFGGDLVEWIVYNKPLSTAERLQIEQYLSRKYLFFS